MEIASIKDFIISILPLLKKNKARISTKFTKLEHVSKLGFLSGLNTKFSSLPYYKYFICSNMNIDIGDIELIKERTFYGNYSDDILCKFSKHYCSKLYFDNVSLKKILNKRKFF